MHPSPDDAPSAERGVQRRTTRLLGWPLATLGLILHFVLAFSAAERQSNVFDEALHQTAGFSYWVFGDYRIHPENGNLPQRLFGLPLAWDAEAWRFPSTDSPAWRDGRQWTVAHRFYFGEGNDFRTMISRGRAVAALIGTGVVALVWWWSRRLFGPAAGALSLALAALSPTLLANGPLMTSDALLALLLPASLLGLWTVFQRVTPGRLATSAGIAGLLFVAKFSAPIVIPMALVLGTLRLARSEPLPVHLGGRRWELSGRSSQLSALIAIGLLHALVVFAVVWAFYGFRYTAFFVPEAGSGRFMDSWETLLETPGAVAPAVAYARDHRLLPEAYLYGAAFVDHHSRARFAFARGEFGVTGWWWFFPYAFLVKTPPALFGLLALAVVAALHRGRLAAGLYATAPLWTLLAVYWAASLPTNVNVGLRHVLPTYPALFVLAGVAVHAVPFRPRLFGPALGLLILAFTVSSFGIRPHYLAYFNALAGGPENAYRALVDSSLDWGQDLPGLARWLEENAKGDTVHLSYFGSANPPAWGVEALPLPSYHEWSDPRRAPFVLRGGLYCISATMLQGIYADPPGPWTGSNEAAYQRLRASTLPLLQARGPRAAAARSNPPTSAATTSATIACALGGWRPGSDDASPMHRSATAS